MPTVVTDPFGGLLGGMVQGYHLAHQIKQQAMQEEAFQRQKADQEREASIKDMRAKMMLGQSGRPVTAGAVQDNLPAAPLPRPEGGMGPEASRLFPEMQGSMGPVAANMFPSTPGGEAQIPIVRPVDKARRVTYKGLDGQKQDYELYTPEEQLQRHIDQLQKTTTGEEFAKAMAGADVRKAMLARDGVTLPDEISSVLYPGMGPQKAISTEVPGLAQKVAAIKKENRGTLKPGEKAMDYSGAQPTTIAENAPLEDPKTRNARSYYASLIGKKPEDLGPQELAKAVPAWEDAIMNPLDKELKKAELKAKPFDLQAKRGQIANQELERQIKGQELQLAGDPDTIDMASEKYLQTGLMPALGMGSTLLRAKIMGRAAEKAKERGLSADQVPGLQDSYKAMSKSLSDLQTKKGQLEAFEKGGAKNLDNFIALAQKQIDSGSPLANRVLRGASRTITGSGDQAAADTARMAAYNEISKILSGSMGNSGVSDSARKEAEGLLNGDYTMGQLQRVAKVLRQDMKNRTGAYGTQIDEIRKQMQGLTKPGSTPAAGPSVATHRFNPATGQIEEIK